MREGDKSNKSEHVTAAVFNRQLMETAQREREGERAGGGVDR